LSIVSSPTEQRRTPPQPAVGLSAAGVVVIVLAGSTVGMIIDAVTGGGIGWIFGAFFILSSLYAALQVRTRDRLSAAIVPPLVFALLILVNGVANGGGLATIAVKTANDLLTYGPMLWIGTGLACAVVGYRTWRLRRP
jgi:hypothetical protein